MSPETVLPQNRSAAFPGWRERGVASLVVLLYGVLLDAAVETFASGSPTRWWVVAPVGTYLALSGWLWRARRSVWDRFERSGRASASFLLLLGVLALTAWLPGGLTDGVRVLRQATSTVLSTVTAAAVVWGAILLLRARSLPAWTRAAVALIALYGVTAFVVGEGAGISYFDLLHGAGFWRRLPLWLQGVPIGALVLVPATVLFQVWAGLLRLGGAHVRSRGVQILGLTLSVVIAVAGARGAASTGYGLVQMQTRDLGSGERIGPIVFARGESGFEPVGRADRFAEGTKSVYAFLDFEGLHAEDTAGATWFKGADKLQEQTLKVSQVYGASPPGKGHLSFAVMFGNGARPGGYFLEIRINGSLAQFGGFVVEPK